MFRHDEAVRWLANEPGFYAIGEKMRNIDVAAQESIFRTQKAVNLYREYSNLPISSTLLSRLRQLKRSDTTVTFNFRDPHVFSLDSALINRLLVFLLLKAGLVEPKLGKAALNAHSESGPKRVYFEGPPSSSLEFDIVILRHGPPSGAFEAAFPELYLSCSVLGGKLARLGLTGHLHQSTKDWYSG